MSEKPDWALMMQNARDLERRAEMLRREAVEARCAVEDSGGARCTADAQPSHRHRYRREDLP